MFRPRIIPVLLLQNNALVKSIKFKNHQYIGDPLNAVKIFNDLKADELVFLDIDASREKRCISPDFVKKLAEETNMPFSVGGGITNCNQIQQLIAAGAEKVILGEIASKNPDFIEEAVGNFGSSTIAVCMDVKNNFFGKQKMYYQNGQKSLDISPIDFAHLMEQKGAGEIILQSIEQDGTMEGYNLELVQLISQSVSVPVVALGGAGDISDLNEVYYKGGASAMGAGSLFIYQSKMRGVLINYPTKEEIKSNFTK